MKSKIFAKSSLQAPAVKASAESAIRNIPRGFNMPVATAKVNLRGLVLRQFEEANPPMISDAVLQPYLADMEKYGIRPNLKLCKINQEVGNGVFLAPDANPIPENQFIGLYGGEYIVAHSEEDVDSDYLFTVFTDIELQNSELDLIEGARNFETNQFCLEVDGKKKGNFCRYFNHTSAEHANLKFCYVCMKDGSIQIAFYTKKTVYPGEQLMLDYKNEFWRAKKIQPKIETPKTYTLTRRGQIRGS